MTLHRPCAPDFEHFGPDATPSTPPHLFLQLKPFLQLQQLHPYHHLWTPLPSGMKHYLLRSAQMTWLPWNSSSKRTTQAKYLILTPLHQSDFGPWCISRKSTRWSNTSLSNFALVNISTQPWSKPDHPNRFEVKSNFFHNFASRDGHHINPLLPRLVPQNLNRATERICSLWNVPPTSLQSLWRKDRWTYLCPTWPRTRPTSCCGSRILQRRQEDLECHIKPIFSRFLDIWGMPPRNDRSQIRYLFTPSTTTSDP